MFSPAFVYVIVTFVYAAPLWALDLVNNGEKNEGKWRTMTGWCASFKLGDGRGGGGGRGYKVLAVLQGQGSKP